MKNIIFIFSLLVCLSCGSSYKQSGAESLHISQPVHIEDDEWSFTGTENMIFVPENRNNPDSRKIPLHFFRFPAKEKSNLAPVVFLGAGPGEPYSVEVFFDGKRAEAWRYELNFVNQKREVILINQRGNGETPGMQLRGFRYKWNNGGRLDTAFDISLRDKNRREAYVKFCKEYEEHGIDLAGYDILHFVDDIEAVRKQLDAPKFAFIGNSFASQWAMGYIRRYPQHVDRALFSGVEPLDHNYDDPQGIWKVLERIDAYAQADPDIMQDLPEVGLTKAFESIIDRLEAEPQSVVIKGESGEEDQEIVVGADDLRFCRMNQMVRSYTAEIESWPKYITEMYQGDFRFLASMVKGRIYNSSSRMLDPLFNNSLGISKEREAVLHSRPARKYLGDISNHYTATRDVCPSPKVPDAFRQHQKHDIPILMIQGDMDLSTPYENAVFLQNTIQNGHLITIKRGFHNAKRALIFADSSLTNRIYEFMNLDFEKEDFQSFRKSLPSEYELPGFDFWPIKGESLYEKYAKEQGD